jgi:flavin-dependent dehydrogenase
MPASASCAQPSLAGPAMGDGWEIEVMGHGVAQGLHAAFLVIAAGKNSPLARPRHQLSACTLALAARWRNCGLDEPVMFVDVGTDFWSWGCSLPGGTVHAAVFLDRDRCPAGSQAELKALCGQLLAESPLLARHVNGDPIGRITGYDATPYRANSFAGLRFVHIGDAAVSLDPLSSQGVQTALSTALQGSLVAHTILTVPTNTTAAVEFYESRCGEVVTRHRYHTARLYSQQAVHSHTEFWQRRSVATESSAMKAHVPLQHRHVLADLATAMRYRIADGAQLVDLPAAVGDIISLQPSLVHPSLERPLTYLGDLPVAQLLSEFSHQGSRALDVINRLSRGHSHRKYEHAIRWLIAMGVLIPEP